MRSVVGATFAGAVLAVVGVVGVGASFVGHPPVRVPQAVILATGDDWGEVEPCGCHLNPRGGIARLATTIAQQRLGAGLTLLIDGGDALYPHPTKLTPQDAGRARLILEAMSGLHYDAVAVGERDLSRGLDALKQEAAELHVPLLAANLLDRAGQHPFPGTRIVETPIGKVGVFAITDLAAATLEGLRCEDPLAAAKAAVADLHQHQVALVVGLFHMPATAAEELTKGLDGVDAVIVSHEGKAHALASRPPLYAVGSRGREVARITLDLGPGPIQDPIGDVDYKDRAGVLDNSVRMLEHRLQKASSDELRASGEAQLEELRKRRDQAVRDAQRPVEGRLAHMSMIPLGKMVADDPVWAAKVAAELARDGRTPGHGNKDLPEPEDDGG